MTLSRRSFLAAAAAALCVPAMASVPESTGDLFYLEGHPGIWRLARETYDEWICERMTTVRCYGYSFAAAELRDIAINGNVLLLPKFQPPLLQRGWIRTTCASIWPGTSLSLYVTDEQCLSRPA